jgi:hypothetical protein
LRHAEKKLVRSSLLVLNHIEACVKANVLKSQHATQATCQMLGLNQIPDSNPNKTNQQQLILISKQKLS